MIYWAMYMMTGIGKQRIILNKGIISSKTYATLRYLQGADSNLIMESQNSKFPAYLENKY